MRRGQHPTGGRFPTTRLPDQAQRLAGPDLEADAIDRVDEIDRLAKQPPVDREELAEIVDLQKRLAHALAPIVTGTLSQCQQATLWPPPMSSRGGSSTTHLLGCEGAPGMEAAPGWWIEQVGRLALQRGEFPPGSGDGRSGAEQKVRVGVARALEHLEGGPVLDELAGIHDADRVGDLGDDGDVVRDVDQATSPADPGSSSAP